MAKYGRNSAEYGKKWLNMVENGQVWQKTVE